MKMSRIGEKSSSDNLFDVVSFGGNGCGAGAGAGAGAGSCAGDIADGACQCRMNNTHLCRSKSYQFEV